MTLVEHLTELRRRLIFSLLTLLVATLVLWAWSGDILSWLARPVGGLVFLAPTEAFLTRLKIAFFAGLFLALPVLLYQAWAFTACAMGTDMRRIVLLILPLSYLLFMAGAALCLFVVVPAAMRFLLGLGTENVRPMMAAGSYAEFVGMLAAAFGAVFQIPLVLVFLNRAGVVSRSSLRERRPY
ncbi:MAG: twin-arginine translocase subunit TatC, partial [Elusimicrobiota bacterium]